jgi:hypothetical protein
MQIDAVSKEMWKVFSSLHSPYPNQKKDESIGYFYPPCYGFLHPGIQSIEYGEIAWLYNYAHEIGHVYEMSGCALGQYMQILYEIYEILIILSSNLYEKNKTKDAEECKNKAKEIWDKLQFLAKKSEVLFEVGPTSYQVRKEIRKGLANQMFINVNYFFPNKQISEDFIYKLVEAIADKFEKEISKDGKQAITHAHKQGYKYGSKILQKYNEFRYVFLVPRISLHINLNDADPIGKNLDELENLLEDKPYDFDPETRLLSSMELPKEKVTEKQRDYEQNWRNYALKAKNQMKLHPSLPESYRNYTKKLIENEMEIKKKSKETMISEQEMAAKIQQGQTFRIITPKGELFFLKPLYLRDVNKQKELAKGVINYSIKCEEASRKLLGYSFYHDSFMDGLRESVTALETI